ncbi:hypothetical protein [Kitasatospora purpeofusca]|uniref:hypothetical protein n=1 Tax=Kitasatospora purpeofusca TaxID=67352 RepID=UPI0035DF3252
MSVHRAASLATTGLLLACGGAAAPAAHAATAGCGNNIADYTGAAFTITTGITVDDLPSSVTFNSDGTVTNSAGTGSFQIAPSTLAVGGSGTLQARIPAHAGSSYGAVLAPKCLVGTTVRQLNGSLPYFTTFVAMTLSRPSL